MEASFWHQKWEENDIAFHQEDANPALVAHFHALGIEPGGRVFVPLCGKTRDIHWLLSNGYRVAGAELSKIAIEQLFADLGITPEISGAGTVERYSAEDIDIFAGNLFDVSKAMLGPIDAVYDRAALVALPEEARARYARHITDITNAAPQLLICYVYDQSVMDGPPFSICDDEVMQRYADVYRLSHLASDHVPNGLKGICPAKENVWLLAE
ncbi:MAG: thiopurine S-methyltransferase [Candidatus Hydrogenedentes bacterium]|nr:thiopurine S-methyltransferase [Candidatus Hydrogenedentota bacterium]